MPNAIFSDWLRAYDAARANDNVEPWHVLRAAWKSGLAPADVAEWNDERAGELDAMAESLLAVA